MTKRGSTALAVVVVTAAFPLRFHIGGGRTASLFDVALFTVAAGALLNSAAVRGKTVIPTRIMRCTVAVAGLSLLSIGWSTHRTQTILHTVSWIEAALVVAFCATRTAYMRPEQVMRWIARFTWLLIAGGVLLELHVPGFGPPSTIDILSGDYASYYTRFSHPFLGRSNNLATVLAVVFLPLAWWAVKYRRHRLVAVVCAVGIAATLSRGVIVALVVAAVFAVPSARRTARKLGGYLAWLLFAAVATVSVVIFAVPSIRDSISTRLSFSNITSRLDLLHLGAQEVTAHPLLGIGGGNGSNIHDTFVQQLVYYGLIPGTIAAVLILVIPRWFFHQSPDVAAICGWSVVGVWLSCVAESSLEGTLLLPEIFLAVGLLGALVLSWERHGEPAPEYARTRRNRQRAPNTPIPRPPAVPTVPVEDLAPEWQRALGLVAR